MKINQAAVVFWLACSGVGYLCGDMRGAVWGFLIGCGISLIAQMIPTKRR